MDGPITLEDAKLHLRVSTQDEDANISRLIAVAARQIETVYGVVSVQREESFGFDAFRSEMRIPLRPLQPDGISISYLDATGEPQSFTAFRIFERYGWSWISPAVGSRWPQAAAVPGAITVTATVGYIDPDAEEEIQVVATPVDLQQACRLLVEHLFLRTGGAMPAGVDDLLEHYRFQRV